MEENLPVDILKLIEIDFVREENGNTSNKRQHQDSGSKEERDEITGNGIRPLQETVGDIGCNNFQRRKIILGIELIEFYHCQLLSSVYFGNFIKSLL